MSSNTASAIAPKSASNTTLTSWVALGISYCECKIAFIAIILSKCKAVGANPVHPYVFPQKPLVELHPHLRYPCGIQVFERILGISTCVIKTGIFILLSR